MASTGLVDLLELPLEKRSEALRETWPPSLDASLTGHGETRWKVEDKAAVDIAVLIIRAINAHCDPLDPAHGLDESTISTRRKTERRVQLFRYSWYGGSSRITDQLLGLQAKICTRVLSSNTRVTFSNLIEGHVLTRSLWARQELLAWSLMENVQDQGAGEWKEQKITSILNSKNQTVVEEPAILEQLAERGLVRWKWDGETPLVDFLTSKVKLGWSTADGKAHQGIQVWPRCLRIRYDPRGRENAPGFQDLARLALSEDGEVEMVSYRLLATVRLGGEAGCDFVRIYDSDCRDCRPLATQALDLPHVNDEWKLGRPGSRYMLYYLRCDSEPASGLSPREVTTYPWLQTELVEQLRQMPGSAGGGEKTPLPYGSITLGDSPDR
ncbi:hypothetical protein LA080_016020 [Diaporthe eres]|nr:hypothetical protein LA080_016020 [Diaporthe eres]